MLIIRHAEKPAEGNELNLPGRERAAALVPFFSGVDDARKFKTPTVIVAQAPKNATSSIRALETVKPLADALHLTVKQPFIRDDYKKMVDEVMHNKEYDGQTVLICWEHKVIPDMAKDFGVEGAPQKWLGEVYDRVWVITFSPDKKPVFQDLPQRLMFGDAAQ